MYIEAKAGQREMGQRKAAEGSLLSAFTREAFETLERQQQEFLTVAGIVRRISDNFVPDLFRERKNDELPDGCLNKLLEGNEKALLRLQECVENLAQNGLQPYEQMCECAAICQVEEERLEEARLFMANWNLAHPQPASSQREHNAV